MTAPNTPAETSDQLNKPAKSGKLEVSDLITIGVFAALYFVMVCIATLVSTLFTGGFGSIFLPAITALISGCVYMLLAARLGKFGGITVMGVIIGPIMGTGMRWRQDPDLLKAYSRVTWLWAILSLVRAAIQIPLIQAGQLAWLGATPFLFYGLVGITIAASWWVIKRTLPPGHPGIRQPQIPASA